MRLTSAAAVWPRLQHFTLVSTTHKEEGAEAATVVSHLMTYLIFSFLGAFFRFDDALFELR